MLTQLDYSTAREKAGFSWHVAGSQGALRALSGVPIRDFNLQPEAVVTAYREGQPKLTELFGGLVPPVGLAIPHCSYGHVNTLGSELLFPAGGELCQTHIYGSLEEGVRRLQQPVDFASAGMAPFYLKFREQLQQAFPGQNVAFTFGLEGPLTTAYELRGDEFWLDLYDQPQQAQEFLRLLTASIIEFAGFLADVHGRPRVAAHGGMCDDLASAIPADLFPTFVIPSWEQYYRGTSSGGRNAHVEDLRPAQLPYLETIGLSFFDPSISPKLNPRLLRDGCRVPFAWRLGSFHYLTMSVDDVRDFVYQLVADGASQTHTIVEEITCRSEHVPKVIAFAQTAAHAKELLSQGVPRAEIGQLVSAEGRERLWSRWPE